MITVGEVYGIGMTSGVGETSGVGMTSGVGEPYLNDECLYTENM
jgi:hypothetical protein